MASRDMSRLVSNFTRLYILTILYEGPAYGYDIMAKYEEIIGKKISPGIVYPFLQKLEAQGYLSYDSDMVGEKERKMYRLTEAGVGLAQKLFTRFAGIMSSVLEPTLDVCAHCGCKVYEGAHVETIGGHELSFCCVHCADHYRHGLLEAPLGGMHHG